MELPRSIVQCNQNLSKQVRAEARGRPKESELRGRTTLLTQAVCVEVEVPQASVCHKHAREGVETVGPDAAKAK